MNKTVKVDELAKAITAELQTYREDVVEGIKKNIDDASEFCRDEIKRNSPSKTGKYKRGWKVKVAYESKSDYRVLIMNTTKPQLTHLLEKPHVLKNKEGKIIGRVGGHPHIAPAEQKTEKKLLNDIKVTVRG